MANFKLGKKLPRRLMSTPSLGNFLDKATTWPAVPAQGWEYQVPTDALNILGNDQWGDCTCAGVMHLIQAQSYNTGRPIQPTTEEALALYTAVTGFDPNAGPSGSNPTDQGAACTSVLDYWQKTGVTAGGALHKIVGYASLDISSLAQMRYAAYTFGGLYLGINCPDACQQNTTNWNFAPGLPIEGGHCIVQLGQGADGGHVDSWGINIPVSNSFILGYVDEAYCVITQDWINQNSGKTPTGLDLNGLLAAMKAI
jgi:hypothetical protein